MDTPKNLNSDNLGNNPKKPTKKTDNNSNMQEEKGVVVSNKNPRNQLNGISLEHWLDHLRYHRNAMEARRSIEIKVFTGCVAILLLIGKSGYDILIGPGGTEQLRTLLQFAIFSVPLFLFFFLLQIEYINKEARENYSYIEKKMESHFKNDVNPKVIHNETFFFSIFTSWAATWPFLATLFLSVFVFLCFKFTPLNVKVDPQNKTNIDIQSTEKAVDKAANISDKKVHQLVEPKNN